MVGRRRPLVHGGEWVGELGRRGDTGRRAAAGAARALWGAAGEQRGRSGARARVARRRLGVRVRGPGLERLLGGLCVFRVFVLRQCLHGAWRPTTVARAPRPTRVRRRRGSKLARAGAGALDRATLKRHASHFLRRPLSRWAPALTEVLRRRSVPWHDVLTVVAKARNVKLASTEGRRPSYTVPLITRNEACVAAFVVVAATAVTAARADVVAARNGPPLDAADLASIRRAARACRRLVIKGGPRLAADRPSPRARPPAAAVLGQRTAPSRGHLQDVPRTAARARASTCRRPCRTGSPARRAGAAVAGCGAGGRRARARPGPLPSPVVEAPPRGPGVAPVHGPFLRAGGGCAVARRLSLPFLLR